ncbi:acyloxyacyl hydrolase [uncultured Desulfosarcina sp.]|uniref:acyloxyacyl hydrolase n=1 Tax=uncultured Desulfosarcina sp. TaxID=218289 RepID=UPI0029C80B28|nr:acyloxyacyl hydrolase [uncultured Desulfosarcina sp.]
MIACRAKTRVLFASICTALFLFTASDEGCAFDDPSDRGLIREIRCGVAAHDVDGLWSGSSKEKGPDIHAEAIFNRPLFRLFAATAYPDVGADVNTRGNTSKIFGGLLLQWEPSGPFFFSTGAGLALHDGKRDTADTDRKSLGSRVLFRIPVEIGYAITEHHRVTILFDHVSNAYLASPNEGMDTLGIVYGYRF